jgi:4-hydroxy-tetrahydrodipicolinate synthase
VQYIKLCMAEVGLGSETTRAPRLAIDGEEREQVLSIIRHALATRPTWTTTTTQSAASV